MERWARPKKSGFESRKINRVKTFIHSIFSERLLCMCQAMFFVLSKAVNKTEDILAFMKFILWKVK